LKTANRNNLASGSLGEVRVDLVETMGKSRLPNCASFVPKPGGLDLDLAKVAKMARFRVRGDVGSVIPSPVQPSGHANDGGSGRHRVGNNCAHFAHTGRTTAAQQVIRSNNMRFAFGTLIRMMSPLECRYAHSPSIRGTESRIRGESICRDALSAPRMSRWASKIDL